MHRHDGQYVRGRFKTRNKFNGWRSRCVGDLFKPINICLREFYVWYSCHTSSQKLMNKQWYNNLAPDLKPFLKVMVMSFGIRDKRLIMNYYICLFFFQNLIYSNFFLILVCLQKAKTFPYCSTNEICIQLRKFNYAKLAWGEKKNMSLKNIKYT